jgi:hypothetical protein
MHQPNRKVEGENGLEGLNQCPLCAYVSFLQVHSAEGCKDKRFYEEYH